MQERVEAIDRAVQLLCRVRADEPKNDLEDEDSEKNWKTTMTGRWRLLFSTEAPLVRLISVGMHPFFSTGSVYQIFNDNGLIIVSME